MELLHLSAIPPRDEKPLNEWREIANHSDGGVAQSLVLLEMSAHENELRTELMRPPSCHSAMDSKSLGFVGRGEHHSAAYRDGLASQRGI
jgi:hypothetical protein